MTWGSQRIQILNFGKKGATEISPLTKERNKGNAMKKI